jgi:hypothetical protein
MNSIQLNGSDPGPSSSVKRLPGTAERLRERAVALRRAGRSRREIKEILGIGSNETLNDSLRGEPPPEWTRRPRAKDDLHARARELREQGLDYDDIAASLGVSKSSVSLLKWPMFPARNGSGRELLMRIHASFAVRSSKLTTRGQSVQMWVRATTAACGSKSGAALTFTGRSMAGPARSWPTQRSLLRRSQHS